MGTKNKTTLTGPWRQTRGPKGKAGPLNYAVSHALCTIIGEGILPGDFNGVLGEIPVNRRSAGVSERDAAAIRCHSASPDMLILLGPLRCNHSAPFRLFRRLVLFGLGSPSSGKVSTSALALLV